MKLPVHDWYTAGETVAAFGGEAASRSYCDGQFVVLPTAVLCLATIGGPEGPSDLPSPSCFVWRPLRRDYHPGDEMPWLPGPVREGWDRTETPVRKLRDHHVFLRTPADDRYFYAGPAHLGSYGGTREEVSACFSLEERVPRDAWLQFGGYPGWLVEVNHQEQRVEAGDLPAFERLLEEIPRREFSHLSMGRYEEDSLTLHTNARRGWLMYLEDPDDSGLYPHDVNYQGDPDAVETFECTCGIDLEFPAVQTLPRKQAMEAAREFFRTGQLPASVQWAEE